MLILLALLLVLLFFGLGFTLHALWVVAAVLFVAWLIVDWVVSPIFHIPGGIPIYHVLPALMKAVVFGAWIFMIIKAAQDEHFKLPIVGELAEKSLIEQRQ